MSEPRTLDAIQKEYTELCVKAGAAQYQREIMDREVKALNDKLVAVNNEAAKRIELDKATEETTNG